MAGSKHSRPALVPWLGLALFLLLLAVIVAFKQLKEMSPDLIEAISFAQNVAVIATIVFVYAEYMRKTRTEKQRKAEQLIERYNAPDFVPVKAKAATAYKRNIFTKKADGTVSKKEKDDIRDFINLRFPAGASVNFEQEAEGLFSIFTVLNFFEELGQAWSDNTIERNRIRAYFHEIVPDIAETYSEFISAMGGEKTKYYIKFHKMLEDFRKHRDDAVAS